MPRRFLVFLSEVEGVFLRAVRRLSVEGGLFFLDQSLNNYLLSDYDYCSNKLSAFLKY